MTKDDAEALKWYRKAAEQGKAEAQAKLGLIYANGYGAPKDDAEALKWGRKAADQGNADAQFLLGCLCPIGKGVPKDGVEAYKWFNLSAAGGDTKAAERRASLAQRMTPDQIAVVQHLIREFRSKREIPPSL